MNPAATSLTPLEVARRSAEAMWASDRASQELGIEIVEVGVGTAVLAMTVRPAMTNGHGTAHGGFIFALADSAFAFARNSHGEVTVASQGAITFLRPGRAGDRLVATAREVTRAGRSGIYDVRVARGEETIAEFRGHSRTIAGSLIDPPGKAPSSGADKVEA